CGSNMNDHMQEGTWQQQSTSGEGAGLIGVESSEPPSCQGVCEGCEPCTLVLVRYHPPGAVGTDENFYPEVWRCKCRGRFYVPPEA
ncbi:hypothetical protein MIMGU_mgv11b016438mg, partial [Erythranthe guttata]